MKSKLLYLALGTLLLVALASFYFKRKKQIPNPILQTVNPQKPVKMLDYQRIFYPDLVKEDDC